MAEQRLRPGHHRGRRDHRRGDGGRAGGVRGRLQGHRADERDRQGNPPGPCSGMRRGHDGQGLRRGACPWGQGPEHARLRAQGREGHRRDLRHLDDGRGPYCGLHDRSGDPRRWGRGGPLGC